MIIKCKMCGGDMELIRGESIVQCPYCGTNQTLPRVDNERLIKMHSRANHLRRQKEFDKAQMVYEEILTESPHDAEAHWCALLCRYGIEYVEDPYSREQKPTMHRTQFDAIYEDVHYLSALQYADTIARELYEHEAIIIENIRKRYLAIASKEEPFDIFICYKETDASGQRTKDSVYAQEIFSELDRVGFKVFFSRITLEDKLGEVYEPYIFAALGSAKVMLVVGTSAEHMQAEWVKNEWKRFMYLMKQDTSKRLIPVYRDMEAYDMPEEFIYMQAQDYSKIGAMQDLLRGLEKIINKKNDRVVIQNEVTPVKIVETNSVSVSVNSLMRRAQLFMEDENWESAKEYLNKVLDIDPEYAPAYVGKVMVLLKLRKEEELGNSDVVIDQKYEQFVDWKKAMRFANAAQRTVYKQYIWQAQNLRENCRQKGIYDEACKILRFASSYDKFEAAEKLFTEIPDYGDAQNKIRECKERAESCRLSAYRYAINQLQEAHNSKQYKHAAELFAEIRYYKDAEQLMLEAQKKEEIAFRTETAREERAIKIEERKRKEKKKKERVIRNSVIAAVFLVMICVFGYRNIIIPTMRYREAENLLSNNQYEQASNEFRSLAEIGYKDAEERVLEPYYIQAKKQYESGNYEEAIKGFTDLGSYRDSIKQIERIYYEIGMQRLSEKKYIEAVEAFINSGEYFCEEENTGDIYFDVAKKLEQQDNHLYAALMYRKSLKPEGIERAKVLTGKNRIAAGDGVVAIKYDGRIMAIGDHNSGAYEAKEWKDVIKVFASQGTIVGLKQDGTVVASGYMYDGVDDVSGWTDIVDISVNVSGIIGIKKDGTVVTTGYNSFDEKVEDWRDIVEVSSTRDDAFGLKEDGTVVVVGDNEYGQCNVEEWKDIVSIKTSSRHTVGLRADGTVVAVGNNRYGQCDVGEWRNIVDIAVGTWNTIGLRMDGTVVVANDERSIGKDEEWTGIVAITEYLNDVVGIRVDGNVIMNSRNGNSVLWNLLE